MALENFTQQEREMLDDINKRELQNLTAEEVQLYARWQSYLAVHRAEFEAEQARLQAESEARIQAAAAESQAVLQNLEALKNAALARLEMIENG